MKRLLIVLLMIFALCACDTVTETPATEMPTTTTIDLPKTETEAVVYLVGQIKLGNYGDAWYYTKDFENCKTLNTYAYILMLNEENDYYMRNINIELDLDPDYSGELSEEIKTFALKYADVGEDAFGKKAYIINDVKIKLELAARKPPKIGMTRTEAYNSTWGYPDDINKTTTKEGVSEQWVYNGEKMKFIYLDNDIVTAIQD